MIAGGRPTSTIQLLKSLSTRREAIGRHDELKIEDTTISLTNITSTVESGPVDAGSNTNIKTPSRPPS